jgi:hypothetical protein
MTLGIPHVEGFVPPRVFELQIVAQDVTVKNKDSGKVLRATVKVPATRLEPGPRGPRFHVVDYDATSHLLAKKPVDLTHYGDPRGWVVQDQILAATDEELASPQCLAQNVYAIAARTLAAFEFGLGRPVPWGFGGHTLYLVPAAFSEANAYYADDDQALYFGYVGKRDRNPVYTSLSHDIVAHETTHAILDGLRRRYDAPGLPDQPAFHEGFADIVALLSVFSMREVVENLLGPGPDEIPSSQVAEPALTKTPLFKMAEQLGDVVHANRGDGLRDSVHLDPTTEWKDGGREWDEPHRRGEILVACVTQALVNMWQARMEDLVRHDTLSRGRAAEEGSRAARHLLEMLIRAIDYCPPVEFEFVDFLDAVLASDKEVAPDDELEYRRRLTEAFAPFGIEPQEVEGRHLSEKSRPSYRNYHFASLRSDPDEVARFIWDNVRLLRIDTRFYTHVEDVRPSVRIGPDGFVVSETVADYVQELIGSPPELRRLSRRSDFARNVPDDVQIKLFGGGSVIFDQWGGLKYHQTKPLGDWDRQQKRLDYLVRQGLFDRKGQLGFSFGAPLGQRFAQFHRPDDGRLSEEW